MKNSVGAKCDRWDTHSCDCYCNLHEQLEKCCKIKKYLSISYCNRATPLVQGILENFRKTRKQLSPNRLEMCFWNIPCDNDRTNQNGPVDPPATFEVFFFCWDVNPSGCDRSVSSASWTSYSSLSHPPSHWAQCRHEGKHCKERELKKTSGLLPLYPRLVPYHLWDVIWKGSLGDADKKPKE